MTTEVWFRNPNNYVREAVEAGAALLAWDRGQIVKSKVDVIKHADLYFGQSFPWRVLAIGVQGAAEYRSGDQWHKPTAVYPVWEYGENLSILEELLESPLGDDSALCSDPRLPGDERPVLGQEHRVVITNLPPMTSGPGRQFIAQLKELQDDYPEAILHLHGLYAFRVMFGMGFGAVDVDPRTDAQKGNVILPLGKKVTLEGAGKPEHIRQLQMLGYKPVDMTDPKMRCIFNIKSAMWAGQNFLNLADFRVRGGKAVDIESPDDDYQPQTRKATAVGKAQIGDKVTCNTCTLAGNCTHFRDGAVCSLPNAAPRTLASRFETRDADTIVDGLTHLAGISARRLERAMNVEESMGDVDPEVTKLITQVFKMGTEVAKIIDPNLRGGARVQVNVGAPGAATSIGSLNAKQAVASVFRELEGRGIPRDQITPAMVADFMAGMAEEGGMQRAIEAPHGDVIEGTIVQ